MGRALPDMKRNRGRSRKRLSTESEPFDDDDDGPLESTEKRSMKTKKRSILSDGGGNPESDSETLFSAGSSTSSRPQYDGKGKRSRVVVLTEDDDYGKKGSRVYPTGVGKGAFVNKNGGIGGKVKRSPRKQRSPRSDRKTVSQLMGADEKDWDRILPVSGSVPSWRDWRASIPPQILQQLVNSSFPPAKFIPIGPRQETFGVNKTPPLPPVLIDSPDEGSIPEAARHLPHDSTVDIFDRKTGKILTGPSAVKLQDLTRVLRMHAEYEPIIPPPKGSGKSSFIDDIISLREGRSGQNVTISSSVRPQSRITSCDQVGKEVLVTGGVNKGLVGKVKGLLPGGRYIISNILPHDPMELDYIISSKSVDFLDGSGKDGTSRVVSVGEGEVVQKIATDSDGSTDVVQKGKRASPITIPDTPPLNDDITEIGTSTKKSINESIRPFPSSDKMDAVTTSSNKTTLGTLSSHKAMGNSKAKNSDFIVNDKESKIQTGDAINTKVKREKAQNREKAKTAKSTHSLKSIEDNKALVRDTVASATTDSTAADEGEDFNAIFFIDRSGDA